MTYYLLEFCKQATSKLRACANCIKVEQAYAKPGGKSYKRYYYDRYKTKTWTHDNILLNIIV